MHKNICELLTKLSIQYKDISLYELAFTHSSYNNDAKTLHHDYERLEFIGDSIVNFVVADLAYSTYKKMDQGELSKVRAGIVQSSYLADKARLYHFEDYIKLGHSLPDNTRNSRRILEDVFEAFIGALYFDQGLTYTITVVKDMFINDVKHFDVSKMKDYKSELQEAMQAEHREAVKYVVVEENGPAHDKTFLIKVTYNGDTLGIGSGKSKKEAEQNAAQDALRKKAV